MSSGNHIAYIALGSNVGNRIENIRNAVALMAGNKTITLLAVSSVYETLPFGNQNQQNFFNAVIKIQTSSTAFLLFDLLKKIELKLGRLNRGHWGPREIDLDILLFDDLILNDDALTLPHKGMHLRDFVLLPLVEIDNSVVHPVLRTPLSHLLNLVKERTIISKLEEKII
ncbi:MAG: 2-amino-4-hydroxy-6-hydroxymethyldihydropteridine diphosphokinase [Ignavibacterium sp.]|jgi:2-amino-4-hydroxy-6-hydroxymethyldihydropteridine diphosphokinase|uniref:2-amino-4-hydroxy-6-hydroxymethyldihydropteridine pyrophosphokinase n=1 Tax=Ignavibacterium album TaxID=591197 RepID=A0A7V2ZIQ5_9BACT|nr:2-amino-4-hydroxy-6-hydroxymethyldihydropteridine diphosphokinase [Ignavibacterium album]MCA2005008.1 2-amino-4-hydroxy-6-hydroxymethyldihydropteridine diphosphokinase [Ignavibacterium sp.]MCX8105812.1 2-amino-4-hydroxy-6-hydroxymethyldihydropteridine diphosphokinase [Ignavibacterium album]